MKVLVIAPSIYPYSKGGIETHVYNLIRNLISSDIFVRILTKEGVGILYSNEKLVFSKMSKLEKLKYLLKHKFDIIHIHGLPPRGIFPFYLVESGILFLLLKAMNKKIVCTPHGAIEVLQQKSKDSLLYKIYFLFLIHILVKLIDKFIAVNPQQYKILGKILPREKIIFIPPGIPDEEYEIIRSSYFREKYKINKNKKIICYIGRLSPHKRIEDLIMAFQEVLQRYKDIVLVIAGPDAGMLNRIQQMISMNSRGHKNVLLLGEIEEDEKQHLLNAIDIFVSPSSYEAFGLALAEAMTKGIPVISANNIGGKYLLQNGKCGLLYRVGDIIELSNKIMILIENPKLRKKIGKKCRERSKYFKWSKIIKKIIKCYKSCLGVDRFISFNERNDRE